MKAEPRTAVYYFVTEAKQGKWKKGFVDEAREHIVIVTTNSRTRGHQLRIANEDSRVVPSSELLCELEQLELEMGEDIPNEPDIDPVVPALVRVLHVQKRRKVPRP